MSNIIKQKIMTHFNAAAATYEQASAIQMQAGLTLLTKLNQLNLMPATIADAGAGTGFATRQLAQHYQNASVFCIDFAEKMSSHAKTQHSENNIYHITADYDALPFKEQSLDIIFSNFALQWSLNTPKTFAALCGLLKPGGHLIFSTLGTATLHELRHCWKQMDNNKHINDFYSLDAIRQFLSNSNLQLIEIESHMLTAFFTSATDIMRHLKSIGANYVLNRSSHAITTKNTLMRLADHYEKYRNHHNQLPMSYEVIYVIAIKPFHN